MTESQLPEVWMRGPQPQIPALLQPIAFALQQAREEIVALMQDFPEHLLWLKPAGLASPAFHLQHLSGVLDRLFTYAKGEALNEDQLIYLKAEGKPEATAGVSQDFVNQFNKQVDKAIAQLQQTDTNTLTEARGVGRAQLPSTVMGLYTHAAEHTMRHFGQLLVTVKILKAAGLNPALSQLLE
ncbi:hypothetical protein GCM10027037_06030 [Mucilaginibacter koreensis]